jgi:hypothetical protein
MDIRVIWANHEADYFYKRDWTTQITLIWFSKIVFARKPYVPIGPLFRVGRSIPLTEP